MLRAGWFDVGLSYYYFHFFSTILSGVSDLGLNNLELRLNIGSPDADVSSCWQGIEIPARSDFGGYEYRLEKNLYCLCFVFRVVLFYVRSVTQAVTESPFWLVMGTCIAFHFLLL